MAVLLGLVVALTYGAGDFLGGLSARRLTPAQVVQASQLVGLVVLVAAAMALSDQPDAADLARGAGAGVAGLVGLVLLYRGLARGVMTVVAPITALGAAVLPLLWGLADGERPGTGAYIGVVLAIVAVGLVSRPSAGDGPVPDRARETALALVAGAGFGMVFVLLGHSSHEAGVWPLLAARATSVTLLSALLLARRDTRRAAPSFPAGSRLLLVGTGLLDVGANMCFVVATRHGLLSLVAVISSLYPAATVVLANLVLHERVGRRQQLGLGCALLAVVLIAI